MEKLKNFILKYKHGWLLGYVFIYLPWFFYLEQKTNVTYAIIHTKLDDIIPFNELFAIPYFLWFFYICITLLFLLFFAAKEDFYRCCAFLFIGMTISLIIYGIWPNAQDLRPTTFERDNFLVDMIKGLYLTDTPTNVCPSLHVYNSIGAHIAISHCSRLKNYTWVKLASFLLMVSICLSTVFLKQHSVFDGFCAILLAGVMYILAYKIDYSKLSRKQSEKQVSKSTNI